MSITRKGVEVIMERYLERHPPTNSSNAKRPADNETQEWRAPKRYATNKSPHTNFKVGLHNTYKGLPIDTETVSGSQSRDTVGPVRKSLRIPPIILEVKSDWTHQTVKELINRHINRYHMQYRNGSKIAVMCHTVESHQALKEGLKKDDIPFVTYTRRDEKTPKIVIKGLPDTIGEDLPSELNKLGFLTTSVTKLKSRHGNLPCPPYLVQLAAGADISKFKQIKYLFNCVISLEKFKPNRSQGTQCFRCQRFGHSSKNCNLPARCVKCTGAHFTAECSKKESDTAVQCCNCKGEHPANYRNCNARLAFLERQEKKKEAQRKYPAIGPSLPQFMTKIISNKSWADVTKRTPTHATFTDASLHDKQPSTIQSNVTQVDDSVTKEMLDILIAIKKLKSQFITCQSQLEKVTLILTHLGSYV